jgi:hypothetical protein
MDVNMVQSAKEFRLRFSDGRSCCRNMISVSGFCITMSTCNYTTAEDRYNEAAAWATNEIDWGEQYYHK